MGDAETTVMSGQRKCPSCGAVLPADAPMGLCVRCLLGIGRSGAREVPNSGGPEEKPVQGGTPNQAHDSVTEIATEQPGARIGPYKLLQKIGEGGCGVVYMAEQQEPVRRRVALKVIK